MAVVDLRSQPIVQTPYGRWQPLTARSASMRSASTRS